uniref:Uncharacterized protein n=1 Tax=Sciurus vulgaris TaxID=55149 RepID=A0A8D2DMT4_SCIVU
MDLSTGPGVKEASQTQVLPHLPGMACSLAKTRLLQRAQGTRKHSHRQVRQRQPVLKPPQNSIFSHRSEPMPGKHECQQFALPNLRNVSIWFLSPEPRLCVIDEIGKMEFFSQPFIQAVHQTLSSPEIIVLGTIPALKGKPLALVGEIRGRPDVKVFSVSAPCLQVPRPHLLLQPLHAPVLQHH